MEDRNDRAAQRPKLSTPPGRPAGIALLALSLVTAGLLHNHPSPAAQGFADVLRKEGADRVVDAVVHGGFIAVMAAQLSCLAILVARIGAARSAVLVALVLTAIGSGALMLSMVLDGLVVPAIAARYVDLAERQEEARTLFALLGTLIRFLMPGGLLLQAAGLVAWGVAIEGRGALLRCIRWGGIVGGAAIVVAIAATGGMLGAALIASILLIAVWLVLVGVALTLGRL